MRTPLFGRFWGEHPVAVTASSLPREIRHGSRAAGVIRRELRWADPDRLQASLNVTRRSHSEQGSERRHPSVPDGSELEAPDPLLPIPRTPGSRTNILRTGEQPAIGPGPAVLTFRPAIARPLAQAYSNPCSPVGSWPVGLHRPFGRRAIRPVDRVPCWDGERLNPTLRCRV